MIELTGRRSPQIGRFFCIVLIVALALPYLSAAPAPATQPPPVQPLLSALAAAHPNDAVDVIVQKRSGDDSLEAQVASLGGVVTQDLHIINAFAAQLPAQAALELARNPTVRWISLDGPVATTSLAPDEPAAPSGPVNVSNQLGGQDSLTPAVAVDGEGVVHVAFQGKTDSKKDIFYANNSGGDFGPPVNVSNGLGDEDSLAPQLAVDSSGVAHIVFQGQTGGKKDIFYANNAGGDFGAPANVSNELGGEDSLTPDVAVDGEGVAHVVFQGKTEGKKDIFYAHNAGGDFGPSLNVSNQLGGQDSLAPDVAVDSSGAAHVAFQGKTEGKKDIFYANNASGAFDALVNVSNQLGGNDSEAPSLSVDGAGVAHVAFQGKTDVITKKKDIFYAHNTSGAFSAPVNLTNQLGGQDSLAPQVAASADGVAHIVFQGQSTTSDTISVAKDVFYANNSGGSMGRLFNLTNQLAGEDSLAPAVALDSNGAPHVVFQNEIGGKKDVFYSGGMPINLSSRLGGQDSTTPAVAVDSSGAAHVVFQGKTEGKKDIFYTTDRSDLLGPLANVSNGLGDHDSRDPAVAVDGGGVVHVVFQGQTGARKDIFYTNNSGGPFGTPVNLSNGLGGEDSEAPRLAVSAGGAAHVVFQGQTGDKDDVFYTNNSGGPFMAPINLSNQLWDNDSRSPSVAVDAGGAAHVVFQGQTGDKKDIFYTNNRNGPFGALVNVSNQLGGQDSLTPDVAAGRRGAAHVVFQGKTGAKKDIFYTNNSSGAFGPPRNVSNELGNHDSAAPRIALDGRSGVAEVVFLGEPASVDPETPTYEAVYYANNRGGFFAPAVDLSNPLLYWVNDSDRPGVAVGGGQVHAVHQRKVIDKKDVFYNKTAILPLPAGLPVFTTWASRVVTATANTFDNAEAMVSSVLGPDDALGQGGRQAQGAFAGFEAEITPGHAISKVELVLQGYAAAPIDGSLRFTLSAADQSIGEFTVLGQVFDDVVGAGNSGPVSIDVTGSHLWRWSDFDDEVTVWIDQSGLAEAAAMHYDAIGLRIIAAPGADDSGGAAPATPPAGLIDTASLISAHNRAVRAPEVWNEGPHYRQGQGMTVAMIDSGLVGNKEIDKRKLKSVNFNTETHDTKDSYGHGTFVAGILAGNGKDSQGQRLGIAPKVNLFSVRVTSDEGLATESDVVGAMQWVLDHKDQYNIRVINLSLSATVPQSYHTSPLAAAAEILWFNRIVVVVAAGNDGAGQLYAPANDPFVITVGATDDQGTVAIADDVVAPFSAYGVTPEGYAKPDLVAPGRDIVGYLPHNKKLKIGKDHPSHRVDDDYFRLSGTSVAAPIVSGAVALLLQDEPDLNPDQVKQRLKATANQNWPGYDAERAGAGYLDIYAAVHGTTTESANTGVPASQLLWTGEDPVQWDSVNWNSVNWTTVNWTSVNWTTVNWTNVNWTTIYWDD